MAGGYDIGRNRQELRSNWAREEQVPRLASQRSDYFVKAMRDFRDGKRSGLDGTMTEVLHGVSERDLPSLAQYLWQLR
jgi:cytochrome c553